MRRFTGQVVMRDPDGQIVTYAPGDAVPDWADVGDHVVEPDAEQPPADDGQGPAEGEQPPAKPRRRS